MSDALAVRHIDLPEIERAVVLTGVTNLDLLSAGDPGRRHELSTFNLLCLRPNVRDLDSSYIELTTPDTSLMMRATAPNLPD